VEGLAEPITLAVALGESSKSVDELLTAPASDSRTGNAKTLILDVLEAEGEQESDALDARIARGTGLSARTVQNARVALKNEGLVKNVPIRDEAGVVVSWHVKRTEARS
jgi:hypothetical protein